LALFFVAAFLIQTILVNVALSQRDEARAASRVEMSGNTVVLVCTEERR
jgi:hypothetical protein